MEKAAELGIVKKTYGQTLVELGEKDSRIVVVEADLMKASGSDPFKARFGQRYFNVGVAEQNLMGVASGLAAMGKIPFASTFSCFASQKACDQVFNSVGYNNFNVKIVGSYAGLTQEKNGGTHISIGDIAVFRCIPNFVVLVPGDCNELAACIRAAAEHQGPVYIRMARGPLHHIFGCEEITIGKARVLSQGGDITLVTTGITTWQGLNACEILKSKGYNVRHIHMTTIKPIDKDQIISCARQTGAIVTVEDHSRLGGLGSAVTETVCEQYPVPVVRLGLNDCFGETANLDYLMDRFEISTKYIVEAVEKFLNKRKS